MRKIWIDTDPGFDDLVTLVVASRAEALELTGIGVVAGNAPLVRTLHNTLTIADAFEIHAPIYAGCDRALLRSNTTAEDVLGAGAFGTIGAKLPEPTRIISSGHAVLQLIETVLENPNQITLIAIGPLTNIALAMRLEPKIAGLFQEIILMGGSTDRGNQTAAAEFNFYADPEAASIVFQSGAKITMFGLNLTRQVLLTENHLARVRESKAVHALALADMTAHYLQIRANKIMPLHDPVTVVYLLRPDLFTFDPAYVQIETSGIHSLGASICEFRVPKKASANAFVATKADGEAVMELILGALTQ
ncbi:MAG: inosine-uridine preferring nucleoside hydrolase [Deinococcota bacterium]|jgi:purine nucleosidase